jgi:uncharacterized protein
MYLERAGPGGEATSQERRGERQPDQRILGNVVQCDGARATIAARVTGDGSEASDYWAVGRMVSINLGATRTVGLVYSVDAPQASWDPEGENQIRVMVELVGEVRDTRTGRSFDRGITVYPHVGATAHRIRTADLESLYDLGGRKSVAIGQLSQDESILARIAIDTTLDRHFAVLGTTGVGKSSAVALLLHKAIEARPDLRVLILDPHNEFAHAFPDKSIRIDTTVLDLPFWLFRLEELVEVLFRGREAIAEEVDLLRDLIAEAKQLYRSPSITSVVRRVLDVNAVTADTPVPYRMADLVKLIDDRLGLLDAKTIRPALRQLKSRIESALNDPRYRFMFASNMVEDTIHQTIGRIFRVPQEGRPVTCFELAGMPSEVVNSVCSVLGRLAFDMAMGSNGKLKLLVLCEEAHRYMPADHRLGFAPTRHALSRIAKEGRKYGCYLGVVTQRPGELDPTVLSQCSTIFAMRLANERDQDIIRSAIADSSASTLSFLSSMGQREAIAFGEGVATTMRMKFQRLPADKLPGSTRSDSTEGDATDIDAIDLQGIVDRLRSAGRPPQGTAPEEAGAPQQSGSLYRQAGESGYRAPDRTKPAVGRDDFSFRRLYE